MNRIPRQRVPEAGSVALSPACAPSERLRRTAAALIRDAIAHYPGCRVAAAGLDYADAATVHRLIQTARIHITWPEGAPQ